MQYITFLKVIYTYKQINYENKIKELNKQLEIIKTAYIKGFIKQFDKDIKHIEFKIIDYNNKLIEQK